VTFTGTYAGTNVATMSGDGSGLSGGGTQTFTATHPTVGTGPNYFDDPANWSGGTAPDDDETLVFEASDISCLYGLINAAVTPDKIIIRANYTGAIGLPRHNGQYREYRDTELRIGTDGDGTNPILTIEIGGGEGSGPQLVRINTGDKQTNLIVYSTGSAGEADAPAVNWRGTHAGNSVEIHEGSLGIGFFTGQAASVALLLVGYTDSVETGSSVTVGDQVTLSDVIKTGGELLCFCGAASLRQDAGTTRLEGTAAVKALTILGGTIYASGSDTTGVFGTITAITKGDPAKVTSAGHGLVTGDRVRIAAVEGMTELNQREFAIERVDADNFNLVGEDSTSYTTHSGEGLWAKLGSVVLAGSGTLDFSQSLVARQVGPAIDVYGNEAQVIDAAKRITTLSYLTGEFAVHWHGTTRNPNLGADFIEVRR
jgi:hypothetical protein